MPTDRRPVSEPMAYPLETDAERGHDGCHPRARVTFSHHRREPASAELVSPCVYVVRELHGRWRSRAAHRQRTP